MSRALHVAGLEARMQLRGPLPWALLGFVAFATLTVNPAAMVATGDAAVGGVRPFHNSVFALSQVFALTGVIFYPLLTAMIAGRALVADEEARIGDLLQATPLTAAEYILGKLAGVLLALALVVVLHVTLAVVWYEIGAPAAGGATHGPFRPWAYVQAAGVFLVPGVICCAGLALAAAERSRSATPAYVVGTGAFLLAIVGLIPGASRHVPALQPVFAALDLWGARWLSLDVFDLDRGVAFYNHAALELDVAFVVNRLIVLALPALAVTAAIGHHRRHTRGAQAAVRTWRQREPPPDAAASHSPSPARVAFAAPATVPSIVTTAATIARTEWRLAWQQPAFALLVAFAMLLCWEVGGAETGIFDTPVFLTTGVLAVNLFEVVSGLGCLTLLYQITESTERLRSSRLSPLVCSTAAPTAGLLLGVQAAALATVGVMLAACGGVVLAMVSVQGHGTPDPRPLLLVWGLLLAPTLLLWSAMVTGLATVLRHRAATYAASLALLALSLGGALQGVTTWTTNWTLWTALRWTDMGSFELDGVPLAVNRLLVTAAAGLVVVLTLGAFARTERDAASPWASRRSFARTGRRLAPWALLAGLAGAWLAVGVATGFQGDASMARWREYRRLNAATWQQAPPPAVRHVEARLRLEPAQRRMHVDGAFTVDPPAPGQLPSLPFTVGFSLGAVTWTVDGAPVRHEDRSGLHLLPMPASGGAGRPVRVGFRYVAEVPRGITRNGGGADAFVLPSGVLLTTLGPDFLPVPGFVDDLGLDDGPRPVPQDHPPDRWRERLPPIMGGPTAFTSHLEIDAPADLLVNAVGDRVSERRVADRRIAVWQSREPVRYLAVVAGRWVQRSQDGVAVFHHPGHGHNAHEMLSTLAAARRLYSEWFAPYPWQQLTLSEYPDHVTRAQSFPAIIPFSEGMGWRARPGASLAATIVTAHEAAHQWWGHLLVPGRAPGADLLIEGMAHYATLRLLEAEHGDRARIDFARALEARYADRRRVDAERPIARVLDIGRPTDETVIYDRGAWVLWMLDRHLGRTRMDAGLRAFMERFRGSGDHPALQDLLAVLRPLAPSPEAFDAFAHEWIFDAALPELVVRDVSADAGRDGSWVVTASVENIGTGTAIPAVAVFPETLPVGDAEAAAPPVVAQPVRLLPRQPVAVRVAVPWPPARIVVDPELHVLQLNRSRAATPIPSTSRRP